MQQWQTGFDKLKLAYQQWNDTKGASIETWVAMMADDVDFRSLANGQHGVPWTKTRTSPDEVRDYLRGLTSTFKMDHFTVDRYVCEGDTVVAICSTGWRHLASGKKFDTPKVDVWRFKDGKAIAFFEYYDTAIVSQAVAR